MLNPTYGDDGVQALDPLHDSRITFINDYHMEPVPVDTKWSFVTRNVPPHEIARVNAIEDRTPQPGDLILAEVRKIAQHTRIQMRDGRRSLLYPGDKVVVVYGNRYAPDQFEAEVPGDLSECHLVAAGGIAAKALSKHGRLKWPTSIRPEGFCVGADGSVINLANYAIRHGGASVAARKPVISVVGTSMNSGKTTTMASLTRGLSRSGYRVATIKATGTGSGNDVWAYEDAGARLALDFTDAGFPSTFKVPHDQIKRCFVDLLSTAQSKTDVDVILVEIADGLLHSETTELISSIDFKSNVDHVLFAAGESMGAVAGVQVLASLGIQATAISGVVSASRLASIEAQSATGLTVISKQELESRSIRAVLGL